MSEENKKTAGRGAFRKLLVVLLILVAICASGFAGYAFWEMKKLQQKPSAEGEEKNQVTQKANGNNAEPLYQSLNTFTISLKPTDQENDRVLYIGITLRLDDKPSMLTLEKYLPEYRSRLIILLAKLSYEDLSSNDGKKMLVDKIKSEVSKPLATGQVIKVTDVLFNEFILR